MALYGYSKARCNFPSAEAVPAIQRSGGRIPIGQRTRVAAGADAVQKKARGSDGFAGANSPAPLASLLAIRARLSAIVCALAVGTSTRPKHRRFRSGVLRRGGETVPLAEIQTPI